MFFRTKTKENHTKSVQNVRKLVFSQEKPRKMVFSQEKPRKSKKKKDPPPQKKRPQKKSTRIYCIRIGHNCMYQGLQVADTIWFLFARCLVLCCFHCPNPSKFQLAPRMPETKQHVRLFPFSTRTFFRTNGFAFPLLNNRAWGGGPTYSGPHRKKLRLGIMFSGCLGGVRKGANFS